MYQKRILVLCGSTRPGSLNKFLSTFIAQRLRDSSFDVTFPDLLEYELPLYSAEIESEMGVPEAALRLHECFRTHHAVFIVSPEHNANASVFLLNALSWISRIQENGGVQAAFGAPVFALGSASPGGFGGYRGLMALRNVLELGLGAHVLPAMVSVGHANQAFSEQGELTTPMARHMLDKALAQMTRALSGHD
jgi:NAD(P)H-dependent FMN reductase